MLSDDTGITGNMGLHKKQASYRCFARFFITLQIAVILFFSKFSSPWISCYVVVYFLRKMYIEDKKTISHYLNYKIEIALIIVGVLLSAIRFLFEMHGLTTILGSEILMNYYVMYSKMFFGIASFLTGYRVFKDCSMSRKCSKVLTLSVKYSFEIFLVHQFSILGGCSLFSMEIGALKYVVMVSAIVLKKVSDLIKAPFIEKNITPHLICFSSTQGQGNIKC